LLAHPDEPNPLSIFNRSIVTEAQRIARAHRAQGAWDEFFAPMLTEIKNAYSERIVEIANTELSRDKRSDKITALSNALKVVAALEGGMLEVIRDGELARADKLRAEKVEKMTAPQRRLLGIAPQR
jgi:hypothetical protein